MLGGRRELRLPALRNTDGAGRNGARHGPGDDGAPVHEVPVCGVTGGGQGRRVLARRRRRRLWHMCSAAGRRGRHDHGRQPGLLSGELSSLERAVGVGDGARRRVGRGVLPRQLLHSVRHAQRGRRLEHDNQCRQPLLCGSGKHWAGAGSDGVRCGLGPALLPRLHQLRRVRRAHAQRLHLVGGFLDVLLLGQHGLRGDSDLLVGVGVQCDERDRVLQGEQPLE